MRDRRSIARIAAGLTGAMGAAALSLDVAGTLTLPPWAIGLSVLGAGIGTAGTPIAESMLDRREAKRLKHGNEISVSLRSGIASSADLGSWSRIGASVYLIEKTGRPWRRERRLERAAYEHLQMAPPPPPPYWMKGDGVVGRCWEHKTEEDGLQPNEGVVAVPVTDTEERVLGVVSLGTPPASFATFSKSRARLALRMTATTLRGILTDYGIRGL